MKELVLKNLQILNRTITKSMLVYHTISASTRDQILAGMKEMDWENKNQYAVILTSIIKSGKTEKEIIERAAEAKTSL